MDVDDPAGVRIALDEVGYLADEALATVVYLAVRMRRPLLLEGDAGVGKTALAAAVAKITGGELIRQQCYEGIDAAQALYDWDFGRQMVHLHAARVAVETGARADAAALEASVYDARFLLARPLLRALQTPAAVLLIDEIDRADDEFEALLLEFLDESALTVPEFGTVRAARPPLVVLTSNRTRDLHDALKRRCLYHWVEHPSFEREVEILRRRCPDATETLARQTAGAVRRLRSMGLAKAPGVAESVDWLAALHLLGSTALDSAAAAATLGAVVKDREDSQQVVAAGLAAVVGGGDTGG